MKKKEDRELQQYLNKQSEQYLLSERLKSLDDFNSYLKNSKVDKLEEQKRYKEMLDLQVFVNFNNNLG